MRKLKVMLPALIVAFWLCALRGDPADLTVWESVVSHIAETPLRWQTLQPYDDHLIAVSYLRDDGAAELHQSQIEIWTVQSGEATLAVGGAILKPESIGPAVSIPKQRLRARSTLYSPPPSHTRK